MVDTPLKLQDLFDQGVQKLQAAGKTNAELDTGVLLEEATGHGALTRLIASDTTIEPRKAMRFNQMLERRLSGEPVHRIIGSREFYGLTLALNEATLVPRPDTEILVDLAIPLAKSAMEKTGQCRIIDLGTGTGAIALALLNEVPGATAIGADLNPKALQMAQANADALELADRFTALQSDWFSDVEGEFDLIVSNPPYIASAEIDTLDVEVREHDPILALDGGKDGLAPYMIIAAVSRRFMAPGAHVLVEIGHTQAAAVTAYFEASGLRRTQLATDLAGKDRVLCFAE